MTYKTNHARQAIELRSRPQLGQLRPNKRRGFRTRVMLVLTLAACCLNGGWLSFTKLAAQDPDTPAASQPAEESSLTWARTSQAPLRSQLKHLSWQQLIGSLQSVVPERLALVQTDDGSSDLMVTLPAQGDQPTCG